MTDSQLHILNLIHHSGSISICDIPEYAKSILYSYPCNTMVTSSYTNGVFVWKLNKKGEAQIKPNELNRAKIFDIAIKEGWIASEEFKIKIFNKAIQEGWAKPKL